MCEIEGVKEEIHQWRRKAGGEKNSEIATFRLLTDWVGGSCFAQEILQTKTSHWRQQKWSDPDTRALCGSCSTNKHPHSKAYLLRVDDPLSKYLLLISVKIKMKTHKAVQVYSKQKFRMKRRLKSIQLIFEVSLLIGLTVKENSILA